MPVNPYHSFVSSFADLVTLGKTLPVGSLPLPPVKLSASDAPVAIIFSPHPDDECLIGGLALRLMRESKMRVVNVAITLGSNPDRRQARLQELKNACAWLGFDLETAASVGLENINLDAKLNEPSHWSTSVKTISAVLARLQPCVIFFPHETDANRTHIGTHFLMMDALKTLPPDLKCITIETEFWSPIANPNLIVELTVEDTADLVAALSFHVGEVRRNPYHLRMPAWLQDNVRRGAELVGERGGAAPGFSFATLYRARQWTNGAIENLLGGGKQISRDQNPADTLVPSRLR